MPDAAAAVMAVDCEEMFVIPARASEAATGRLTQPLPMTIAPTKAHADGVFMIFTPVSFANLIG